MVVIGGLVGAGALGYDVVYGIANIEYSGKGIAAGFSIVLLGILIDRVVRGAAARVEGGTISSRLKFRRFLANRPGGHM